MFQIALQGILLGLSTGLFCLGRCATALVPYVLAEERPGLRENLRLIGQFLLGRFMAYVVSGLAVGYLGMRMGGSLPSWMIAFSLMGLSIVLIAYALAQFYGNRVRYPLALSFCRLMRRKSTRLPSVLGFLMGISPCPPFLLAMAYVFELGDPWSGLLLFSTFFLTTSLYMLPVVFVGLLSRFEQLQKVARLAALIIGAMFLLMGLKYL